MRGKGVGPADKEKSKIGIGWKQELIVKSE
jgi:hypothetical protein